MAGIDGIKNKIDPGQAVDENLYDIANDRAQAIPRVSASLAEALHALEQDHDFLLQDNVFTDDIINAYLKIKKQEIDRYNAAIHPLEFEMYYSD